MLYDEPHPLGDEIGTIQTADLGRKPDMLIIMGTSLKVHGLKKLVKDFAKSIHTPPNTKTKSSPPKNTKSLAGKVIFVNRTPPAGEWADIIDYHIAGETDVWVDKVVEDWKKMRPADWEVQKTLDGAEGEESPFKVVKEVSATKPKGMHLLYTSCDPVTDKTNSLQSQRRSPTTRTRHHHVFQSLHLPASAVNLLLTIPTSNVVRPKRALYPTLLRDWPSTILRGDYCLARIARTNSPM